MSTSRAFQYSPLHGGQQAGAIRLLTLLPGILDDEVHCNLETVQLADKPRYEALSYTSGLPDDFSKIQCNGSSMAVTPNLLSALHHYRKEHEPRVLWIDAICINQKDDFEKSQQVPLMRSIFASAITVLAWLGPETDQTGDVYLLLLDLARVHGEQAENHDVRTFNELGVEGWEQYELPGILDPSHPVLKKLLDRPYFSRVWTVQELAVA